MNGVAGQHRPLGRLWCVGTGLADVSIVQGDVNQLGERPIVGLAAFNNEFGV
jgi:hypothetical protein